ncbi:FAD-binding oxidoreductase [Ferruginibacter sp. HRS2-29]|uniref:FAD-binding oxidoreductase n=1 Tax=Ferruginibacter sp. HRS2-29 TaxID=2487334 RepID=UPI0020CF9F28|nr:FAD-binding oxidoreductase [Ferruginibacter sp. HRS2-29]MCP9752665.1 hypothetical protein [Ferruginibacter sp. HRS2-29]
MSPLRENSIIQSGIVLDKKQIAGHTFHLKIQSNDFNQMQYVAGFTVDIFLGNPLSQLDCEDRKYSFWNYEPLNNVADFAICTFSQGKGASWIQKLQQGDIIYFKPPKGKLLVDNNAGYYLMIGNITALSHLYEINRNLPQTKKTFSFIYTYRRQDIFADIDGSFPFNYYIINPLSADAVKSKIIQVLPKFEGKGIAYILGEPETCIALQHYFKNEKHWDSKSLKTKPFWKVIA